MNLDSKLCLIYKIQYKDFKSGVIYVQNGRVRELLKYLLAKQKQLTSKHE